MIAFKCCRFLCCCLLLAASACGGGNSAVSDGSGGSIKPPAIISATINGVLIPAAPDKAANSSILGVDENTNGVRDDVERLLASKFGQEGNAALVDLARTYQLFMAASIDDVGPLNSGYLQILSKSTCLSIGLKESNAAEWVQSGTLNTVPRLQAFNDRVSALRTSSVGLSGSLLRCGG